MRKTTLSISITAIAFALVLMTASCRKHKDTEDTGYADDHATSEQVFDDAQNISDQASALTSGSSMEFRTTATTIGGCATVTRTTGMITIDFGTTNCTCKDGRKRRGKIIVTYTGAYAEPGSVHTITFEDFYQNDNKITGTKTVTNMGNNSSGQPYFSVHIVGSVTFAAGGTISTEWTRTRTWTQGYTTSDISDDVYEITGSGTLTRRSGQVVSITITKALVIALNCRWVEAGSVAFSIATGQTRTLNFGDSPNCDDMATVTLANGTVRNITLP